MQSTRKINTKKKKKLVKRKQKLSSASTGSKGKSIKDITGSIVQAMHGLAHGQKQNDVMVSNFEDFSLSLVRLIESSEGQFHSASCDTSEFLIHLLEEYQQTLSTLIARFCEVYRQADFQQTCIAQLNNYSTSSLSANVALFIGITWWLYHDYL